MPADADEIRIDRSAFAAVAEGDGLAQRIERRVRLAGQAADDRLIEADIGVLGTKRNRFLDVLSALLASAQLGLRYRQQRHGPCIPGRDPELLLAGVDGLRVLCPRVVRAPFTRVDVPEPVVVVAA